MLNKMFGLFSKKQVQLQFQATENGWCLTCSEKLPMDEIDAFSWASELPDEQMGQAFYLAQLVTEGIAKFDDNSLLIPWQQIYQLLSDEEHSELIETLQFPAINPEIMPVLDSRGTLSDTSFELIISGWRQGDTLLRNSQLIGAILRINENNHLIKQDAWRLLDSIKQFESRSQEQRSQNQQEMAWGKIRSLAAQANTCYASRYLKSTIILTPESLKLELERTGETNNTTIQVSPLFADAPADWLGRFDTHQNVQDHYDFSASDGLCRVILSEPVKRVLQFIKREMPQRRVVGKKAEAFIRNPYALLGEDLASIIDAPHFADEKKKLGALQNKWHLKAETTNGQVKSVNLHIDGECEVFQTPEDFSVFLNQVGQNIEAQAISLPWKAYSLLLDGNAQKEWQQGQRIFAVWSQQKNHHINYEEIYDLSSYGDRIIGIGEVRPVALPILLKNDDGSQSWSPEMEPAIMVGTPDGNSLLIPATADFLDNLKTNIHAAKAAGKNEVTLPYIHQTASVETSEQALKVLDEFLQSPKAKPTDKSDQPLEQPKVTLKTLLISSNFNTLEYIKQRKTWLAIPENYQPKIPTNFQPNIELKPHQCEGLRWMQYLSSRGDGCHGALLADDMGLGKTLQLLGLLAVHYKENPDSPPSMIIAPVTLLDNWEQEISKFFTTFPPVLRLHGNNLKQQKQPQEWIDQQLLDEGIANFLQPDWLGKAKLVITTYEVVRSYEFSLARQEFTFLICDEAQKIKNPTAIATLAIKKQKAQFKIACTGTPVENHLVDLWNLFDWIQPGLLGTVQEFHSRYRRPIEAKTDEQKQATEELRELIAPQILRRTKQDIGKDLPKKHTSSDYINMAVYQQNLYQDTITRLGQIPQEQNNKQRLKNTWGLLHRIKAICAEPYCLPGKTFIVHKPLDQHLANSPKMDWLLKKLKEIHNKGEKVIVFTELRQVQIALSFFIKQDFNITPSIINGQTHQRQQLIDRFQEKQGFNVIILSPLAAGAGLNIVSANHVIHFTRTWNPAKEAQATDRAYRIGQTKDVHVYCPTVTHPEFMTFEAKLDELMRSKLDLASDMLNGIGGEFSPFDFDVPTTQLATDRQFITLQDVDELDGNDFEKLCQLLLQKEGWDAQQTIKTRGDGGIDIIAIRGKDGLLIQCKRSSKTLGWDAIKEVVGGSARYEKLYPGIIFTKIAMTNQFFNQIAKEQAIHNCVDLWERSAFDVKLRNACINQCEAKRSVFR
jgi:hypothetical protein